MLTSRVADESARRFDGRDRVDWSVTETVYRRELRPVITTGAEVMDAVCQLPRTDQCPGCWKCRLGSGRSQGEERC